MIHIKKGLVPKDSEKYIMIPLPKKSEKCEDHKTINQNASTCVKNINKDYIIEKSS